MTNSNQRLSLSSTVAFVSFAVIVVTPATSLFLCRFPSRAAGTLACNYSTRHVYCFSRPIARSNHVTRLATVMERHGTGDLGQTVAVFRRPSPEATAPLELWSFFWRATSTTQFQTDFFLLPCLSGFSRLKPVLLGEVRKLETSSV